MSVLLDTAVLIAAERATFDMPGYLVSLGEAPVALAAISASVLLHGVERACELSIVTRIELKGGVYCDAADAPARRVRLDTHLSATPVLAFDDAAADAHAAIVACAGYPRRKLPDRMIAA